MKWIYTLFFVSLWGTSFAQTYENAYAKTLKNYQSGKYDKALASLEKEFKENTKEKLPESWYWILKSMIYESQKNFVGFEKSFSKIKLDEKDPYLTNMTALRYADMLMKANKYKDAYLMLEKPIKLPADDSLLLADARTHYVKICLATGKLNEAEKHIDWLISFWEKAQNKKVNYLGNKEKTSKNDINYREQQFVELQIIKLQMIAEKGDYLLADSLFRKDAERIKKLAGKSSPEMAQYNFWVAQNYENLLEPQKAIPFYKLVAQSLNPTHTLSLEAQLKVLQLQKNNKKLSSSDITDKDEPDNDKDDDSDTLEVKQNADTTTTQPLETKGKKDKIAALFQKTMDKYYPQKNHYYRIKKEFQEAENLFVAQKLDKAKPVFQNIINTSDSLLPQKNLLRIASYEYLSQIHDLKTEQDISQANEELKEAYAGYLENFGENALNTNLARIRWADFQISHTSALPEVKNYYYKKQYLFFVEEWLPSHKNYIEVNDHLQRYFDITESYEEAGKYLAFVENEVLKRYGEKGAAFGEHLLKKAGLLLRKHNYPEAEENAQKAATLLRKKYGKRSVQYANALALKARVYAKMGLYEESEDLLRQAGRIYQRKKEKALTESTKSMEDLAQVYMVKADFKKAETLLRQAISNYETRYGKKTPKLITPLNLLAKLYLIQGKYDAVEKQMRVSEEITEKVYGKNTLIYADYLEQMTEFYQNVFSLDKAEKALLDISNIKKSTLGEESVAMIPTLTSLANVRFLLKKTPKEEIINLLEKSKEIALKKLGDKHQLYAEALKNLAIIYADADSLAKADALLAQASAIWVEKTSKRNIEKAEIDLLRGDIALKNKKNTDAERYYTQAGEIYKKAFDKSHPSFVKAQSKIARLAFSNQDYAKANQITLENLKKYHGFVQSYFPALSEQEKERYWQEIQSDFEFFHNLAFAQVKTNPELLGELYNNTLANKGLLLKYSSKLRQNIYQTENDSVKVVYQQWIDQKEELASLMANVKEDDKEVEKLIISVEKLEKQLLEKSTTFKNSFQKNVVKWQDIQKNLKKNEVAVEIVRFRWFENGFTDSVYYAALILTPNTIKSPEYVLLPNGNELEKEALNFYRNSIRFRKNDKNSYNKLWKSIEEKTGKNKKIYFSPDGIYNELNIATLLNGKAYVFDYQDIWYLSSTEESLKPESPINKENQRAFLIGNPNYYTKLKGSKVADLKGTEKEVKQIGNILKGKKIDFELFTGKDASEQKIKNVQSPTILHLATHGFFEENTPETDNFGLQKSQTSQNPLLRAGLLLEGAGDLMESDKIDYHTQEGVLTAYEVIDLPLSKTELVIISACETGVGQNKVGEGVYGLQRSFMIAGAKTVVFSLFKVDDEATANMMIAFYQKWAKTGNKREAFREAQKVIKLKYKSPLYWGAFNMIGMN
ncbi:MAG: CHAT domain-containing protein [Raineya sp.]|jgi:CHAT domain-containing protein|nr:CHAT domain-containing protein [Raineya sp.]